MMTEISSNGYRFPPEIIQQAIWLYLRFTLSFRDVENLLGERGIVVSYETVRRWVNHFGPLIAADLRKRRPKPYTIWHLTGPSGHRRCRRGVTLLPRREPEVRHISYVR
jgi:putative transposase